MKKSKLVNLVLITAALATAEQVAAQSGASAGWDETADKKVYMRSDTTAPYTRTHHHGGLGTALLWYYAFRPYGSMGINGYQRTGFYSQNLNPRSNVGSNPMKSHIARGGFGRSAFGRAGA
jgi:hypothetical protein